VNTVAAAELDGRPVIVSGGEDRTLRIWDLATGTPIGEPLTGHDGAVKAVAMGELESRPAIISGSSDGSLRVWDLATGTPVGEPLTGHSGHVLAVAIGALDGQPIVVSGSSDHTVRVWDLGTRTTLGTPFTGHHAPVTTVVVDELASRPIIISGSQDHTVSAWDPAVSGSVIKTYSLPGEVRSVVCTGGDQWATPAVRQVACAADRAVFLGPLEPQRAGTEEPIADVQLSGRIISAAWHPLGALALGTEDGIAVIRMTPQEVN
jgi:WD40 repeat protein